MECCHTQGMGQEKESSFLLVDDPKRKIDALPNFSGGFWDLVLPMVLGTALHEQ